MKGTGWKLIAGALALAALCVVLALALFRAAPPSVPLSAPATTSATAAEPAPVAKVPAPVTPDKTAPRAAPRIAPAATEAPRARLDAHQRARPRLALRRDRHGGVHRPHATPPPPIEQAGAAVPVATGEAVAAEARSLSIPIDPVIPIDSMPPVATTPAAEPLRTAAPDAMPVPVVAPTAPANSPSPLPVADAPIADAPVAAARALSLSVGTGRLIRLPGRMTQVFVADDKIADVQVRGPNALYLFAKLTGITTVYATDKAGAVIWSSDVRVGANLADVGTLLRAAMPEADITATPLSGMLLLTGTVLSPADVADAQRIVEQATAGTAQVLNGLKVATPQQVSLHVKIAEVNRNVARAIGFNYKTADATGGFGFGIAQGRAGAITDDLTNFTHSGVGTTLGLAGKLFGLDIRQAIDLAETDGFASTLAEPNLTALSGETASFLAGGEIPIPQSQGLGSVSVEFKQYGVSLAFTPTVLSGGRIAIRVRPEVSQLSDVGSVNIAGYKIPGLITRRAETTVELGSGQSFAIGGLLQNTHNNSFDKAPILGDLPVIGALFRSNSFQKQETELVIVVTPYIVKPVDANRIALPTDGYRSPTTAERVLLGKTYQGTSMFAVAPAALAAGALPVATPDPATGLE